MSDTPTTSDYPLFEHMSREHGLTLLDSELHEIKLACGIAELERENATLRARLTPKALADALVRNRLIHPEAIDLPEGYDGGLTLANIAAMSAEILNTPDHQRESGASVVQPTQPNQK